MIYTVQYPAPLNIPIKDTYKIYVGGTLTGVWNWQKKYTSMLESHFNLLNLKHDVYIMNPRLDEVKNLDIKDHANWRYKCLKYADISSFWLEKNVDPIAFYELGMCRNKYYLGMNPDYVKNLRTEELDYLSVYLEMSGFLSPITNDLHDLSKQLKVEVKKLEEQKILRQVLQ